MSCRRKFVLAGLVILGALSGGLCAPTDSGSVEGLDKITSHNTPQFLDFNGADEGDRNKMKKITQALKDAIEIVGLVVNPVGTDYWDKTLPTYFPDDDAHSKQVKSVLRAMLTVGTAGSSLDSTNSNMAIHSGASSFSAKDMSGGDSIMGSNPDYHGQSLTGSSLSKKPPSQNSPAGSTSGKVVPGGKSPTESINFSSPNGSLKGKGKATTGSLPDASSDKPKAVGSASDSLSIPRSASEGGPSIFGKFYISNKDFGDVCKTLEVVAYTQWMVAFPMIHFCPSFFAYPDFHTLNCESIGDTVGGKMSSAASFVIHEWTHIKAVGWAALGGKEINDLVDASGIRYYGPEQTRRLKKELPEKTINNADNYAWMAVQTYWSNKCNRKMKDPVLTAKKVPRIF